MATQDDRSLSSGMSFPRWMKTKMNDKLDFEQSAFSPTELDDSFMFYYRNKNTRRGSSEPPINTTLTTALTEPLEKQQQASGTKPDFSKHTLSCQKYLQDSIDITAAQKIAFPSSTSRVKSCGTDDGFKGEAAKCGTSVIRVANQMVAGKVIRGFNIQTQTNCDANSADSPPAGFNPSLRRASRSLPASPLTSPQSSPKLGRRVNKYFSGPFVDSENHHGGWILSNLLASKRQVISSQSVGYIAEEVETSELKKFNSNTSVDSGEMSEMKKKMQKFPAKPAELREMNFWSPTSM